MKLVLVALGLLTLTACGDKTIRRYRYVTEDRVTYVEVIEDRVTYNDITEDRITYNDITEDRVTIVEVTETVVIEEIIVNKAFKATVTNVAPFQYEPRKILVKVKNVSAVTLHKFKLELSNGQTITSAYGDSTTWVGNGVIKRGNLIAPGETLCLTLELNAAPQLPFDVSVKAL